MQAQSAEASCERRVQLEDIDTFHVIASSDSVQHPLADEFRDTVELERSARTSARFLGSPLSRRRTVSRCLGHLWDLGNSQMWDMYGCVAWSAPMRIRSMRHVSLSLTPLPRTILLALPRRVA